MVIELTAAQLRRRGRLALARQQIPIAPLQPVADGTAERQRQIEVDVGRVDSEIALEQGRLTSLAEQFTKLIESGVSTSAERGALDDRMADLRRAVKQLHIARSNIEKGFTFESSISRATQLVRAGAIRREVKREIKAEVVKEEPSAVELRGFEKAGLVPRFEDGKIVGFSDEVRKLSFPVEFLGEISKSRLDILQKEGLISITPAVEPAITPFPPPPLPTIEVAPTFTKQLERLIQESTPDIPIVPEQIEQIIGGVLGLEKFTRGTISGLLSGARDIEGRRIFTPQQAKGIADITVEVAVGYGTGLVAGKAFTLARGGFLAVLPKAVKTTSTFKTVVRVADIAVLAGLGALEGKRIADINKREGTEAAVIEMIGLVSFGKGFSRAGLKADPQAEAEFRRFTKEIKDLSIKGKRGETSIFRKKKKKRARELLELEQFDVKDVERAEALVGQLERKLLEQKTLKNQLKILAEIRKRLKTPEARKGFNALIDNLLEKEILILPKVEILPGVKVAIPPEIRPIIFKPTIKVPLSIAALRNQARVAAAKGKNEVRVKIATAQKDIGKQRNKILSLVAQKASQKVIQAERFKLAQLQTERLKLRTKLIQVAKLKLKPRLRIKPRLKVRRPPRILIPPPFAKLKIPIKKKKLIKVPLAKGGYNVFVKSKGKFKKVNINPLSKKKAHDLGSWLVDRSTSRTWKRKQVGFKAQKPILKVPTSYFEKTIRKYRGKKIKGKVQPLINLGIEKRKFAIDTQREKKQLSAARVRAELLRKLGLKKPRKTPRRFSSPKLKSTKLIRFKRKRR